MRSVKDGCSPQGQCGCCTVLVDGSPRVACVTPVRRVAGRSVMTVDGLAGLAARCAGHFATRGEPVRLLHARDPLPDRRPGPGAVASRRRDEPARTPVPVHRMAGDRRRRPRAGRRDPRHPDPQDPDPRDPRARDPRARDPPSSRPPSSRPPSSGPRNSTRRRWSRFAPAWRVGRPSEPAWPSSRDAGASRTTPLLPDAWWPSPTAAADGRSARRCRRRAPPRARFRAGGAAAISPIRSRSPRATGT